MALSDVYSMLGLNCDRRSTISLALVLFCIAALSGCDSGPAMSEVSGKVFYKDGTVPQAAVCVVRFEPTDTSTAEIRKGASGAIEPDGSFKLFTRRPDDGVYHGEYAVTFGVYKAVTNMTSLIADKYTRADTTPYKVTVDGDIDDLKFEIEPLPGVKGTPAAGAAGS
jgi:hypothetical protein